MKLAFDYWHQATNESTKIEALGSSGKPLSKLKSIETFELIQPSGRECATSVIS